MGATQVHTNDTLGHNTHGTHTGVGHTGVGHTGVGHTGGLTDTHTGGLTGTHGTTGTHAGGLTGSHGTHTAHTGTGATIGNTSVTAGSGTAKVGSALRLLEHIANDLARTPQAHTTVIS